MTYKTSHIKQTIEQHVPHYSRERTRTLRNVVSWLSLFDTIKSELTIDKKKASIYISRLNSSPDDKISSIAIRYIGATMVTLVILVVYLKKILAFQKTLLSWVNKNIVTPINHKCASNDKASFFKYINVNNHYNSKSWGRIYLIKCEKRNSSLKLISYTRWSL